MVKDYSAGKLRKKVIAGSPVAIVKLVEEMLDLQKQSQQAEVVKEDTRFALQKRIQALYGEINQRVYKLYGLTEEEIRVVEGGRPAVQPVAGVRPNDRAKRNKQEFIHFYRDTLLQIVHDLHKSLRTDKRFHQFPDDLFFISFRKIGGCDKLFPAMSPFLQLAFELVVILLAAKTAGYISTRLGQPSVLGELLIGVLLGPSLINILGLPFINSTTLGTTISELSELGVLLLMFIAGLELHLGELAGHRKVSLLASLGGLLLSIGLGWATGRLFGLKDTAALLLGLALGATSVSISARTLMEMNILRSRVGLSLLGAAVVDDILSIFAFSIFLAVTTGSSGFGGLVWLAARMALFLAAAMAFGLWVLPPLVRRVGRLSISQGILAFAIVMLLVYGLAAEVVGQMAALIGTFLAGLMFARTPEKSQIEPGITSLAYALFVPIFFVNIGLSLNLHELQLNAVWLILVVTLAAIVGKVFGAAAGARLGGFPGHEAFQLGAGMVARGEVTLIVAAEGIKTGLLNSGAFSAIVAAVLLSTLVTPPMLRFAFARIKPKALVPQAEPVETIEEKKK